MFIIISTLYNEKTQIAGLRTQIAGEKTQIAETNTC